MAIKPTGASGTYNVSLIGEPTRTSCVLEVAVVPATLNVVGLLVTAFSTAPAGTKIHATARAPS